MQPYPDLVGLVVRDVAASLRFYRLLGMAIPAEADTERHVEITTPNGLRIAWDALSMMQDIYPNWEANVRGHRMTLAFKCDTGAEVDAVYARLTDAGYHGHTPPWDAFWGQRYAVIQDPDDNLIDLFAAL
jgi:uncharacterized glyoxalase superfamily protein PhnB